MVAGAVPYACRLYAVRSTVRSAVQIPLLAVGLQSGASAHRVIGHVWGVWRGQDAGAHAHALSCATAKFRDLDADTNP